MGVKGCPVCMKYCLVGFNFLVMLCGTAAIAIGSWALTTKGGSEFTRHVVDENNYKIGSIIIIVAGCITFLLAFLGCCGAATENRVSLALYFTFMFVFIIVYVAAAIVMFVKKNEIQEHVIKTIKKVMTDRYGNEKYTTDTTWVDEMQKKLKCCGVDGDFKGNSSWFLWQSSAWFNAQKGPQKEYVPKSCCPNKKLTECQQPNTVRSKPIQTSISSITEDNPDLYTTGCVSKVEKEIKKNLTIVGGIAIGVFVVLLASAIFSIVVCASISNE